MFQWVAYKDQLHGGQVSTVDQVNRYCEQTRYPNVHDNSDTMVVVDLAYPARNILLRV